VREGRIKCQGEHTNPTPAPYSVSFLCFSFFFLLPFVCLFIVLTDRADTQPTQAYCEGLKDSAEKRQVLGGTKAGNGAWALAWVDTVMELPASEEDHEVGRAAAEERKRLLELAAADVNS
jgi:hypothetical protein